MTDFNMNIVTAGLAPNEGAACALLHQNGINCVGDLVERSEAEMQHILHTGWLDELKTNLAGKGLHLGMALPPGWRKAAWDIIEMPGL